MTPTLNKPPCLTKEKIVRFEVNTNPCYLKNSPCSCVFIDLRLSVLELVAQEKIEAFIKNHPRNAFSKSLTREAYLTETSLHPLFPEDISKIYEIAQRTLPLLTSFCSELGGSIIPEIIPQYGELDFHIHLEGNSLEAINRVHTFCKNRDIEFFLGNLPDDEDL